MIIQYRPYENEVLKHLEQNRFSPFIAIYGLSVANRAKSSIYSGEFHRFDQAGGVCQTFTGYVEGSAVIDRVSQ